MNPDCSTFVPFNKMPRLNRSCIVTEKIDGTNAQVVVWDDCEAGPIPAVPWVRQCGRLFIAAGSRSRWITPESDNYGFAKWVLEHAEQLATLGPGRHFGEWWGSGVNRGYGLLNGERRFSLFNASRWNREIFSQNEAHRLGEQADRPNGDVVLRPFVAPPDCCSVVPVLWRGIFSSNTVNGICMNLAKTGSKAAPGYDKPEGVVVFHCASNEMFKVLIDNDHQPKGAKPV